jgi:hypothetical protein
MAKAKPKPEDETGTPEKKPRKSRKASEAVPENGADESTPKKERAAKKTPEAVPETGTEVEPTPKKRQSKKKRTEAVLENGVEEPKPKKRRATKKTPEPVLETGTEAEPTPKKRRGTKKSTEAGTESEASPKRQPRSSKKQSLREQDGFIATTPVAERLAEANIWSNKARKKKPSSKIDTDNLVVADSTRVNIVSDKLCGALFLFHETKPGAMGATTQAQFC